MKRLRAAGECCGLKSALHMKRKRGGQAVPCTSSVGRTWARPNSGHSLYLKMIASTISPIRIAMVILIQLRGYSPAILPVAPFTVT